MPHTELEYPKQPYGTVKRYSPRATYALRTIHSIINTSPILHVSFNVPNSPFPNILPMLGQMASFARPSADEGNVLDLYLHGYVSSRLMHTSRDVMNDSPEGMPVCVAASHVDGLVMALTPNSHSYNYRSAVLFGFAAVVNDHAERMFAMELITNGVVPGSWSNTRLPPNNAELSSTSVLKVTITTGSAKIRSGPPADEKNDKENVKVVNKVWSGVVPVYQTLGKPVPGPYNVVDTPSYITDFVKDRNEDAQEHAIRAATRTADIKAGPDQ
ncbi:flavin-nucleotide-binding protein [Colletotrichum truncatum]|uniref:Flavin-nucleotide-binding protein n=1 Tax=Colletotrichum truncatum TaxID=5467 RepID=A0ACC3YQR3_COLTU|nr:flavin-nucleotide-binding protein [Colletotrichum truncatum]KAF6798953.1 flavin-nucleotide-binding protein [Colletotrichum truncatum]